MERFYAKTKLATEVRHGMTTPCLEWTAVLSGGYGQFWMASKMRQAHRVAWEFVHGQIPDGIQDAHGSKTHPECVPRGDRNGSRLHPERVARGERAYGAKLTEAKVLRIRELCANGWTQQRIADAFGVCQQQISKILDRQRWNHVAGRRA
jgi:hypothetical protein